MAKSNNIDIDIMMALKVCEKSGVTPLFLGNPGIGKSSAVQMFCDIRGYDLLILRGSSSSPEELLGYDVANEKVTDTGYAKKLYPSWLKKIESNHEKGIPTLLFLDELSTCNEFTQAAMLEIIFSRRVSEDKFLPEDCFVVAAGNYFANLSSSFNMIPPILNRFAIFNLTPTADDLEIFLSKYNGSLSGKRVNTIDTLKKEMEKLDKQEKEYDQDSKNRIGEYIERAIREQTKYLIAQGQIDLTVADLSGLYSNDYKNGDPSVFGFVTFRTLNYLRDISVAYYTCFGVPGIKSSNYRKAIDGLCGIGLSWKSGGKKNEPDINQIGKYYFDAIGAAANEIKKMSISKLPEYEKYLSETTDGLKTLDVPVMQALLNKMTEMKNDADVKFFELQRPIDISIINNICKAAQETMKSSIGKINLADVKKDSTGSSSVEKIIGYVTSWNTMADLLNLLGTVITDTRVGYKETDIAEYKSFLENIKLSSFKLRSLKKLLKIDSPEIYNMIPEINTLNLCTDKS